MSFKDWFTAVKIHAKQAWALSMPYFTSEEKWHARALLAGSIGLSLAIV